MDEQGNQGDQPQMNYSQYLFDLSFPADKQRIISHAQQKGATEDIMKMLQMLPEKQYQNIGEITSVLSGGGVKEDGNTTQI